MGKKLKTGKQRKDKFYRYAKEAGYRSRAAFKLLQLNKKYNFLQTSKVLIDLCAAPGGWLQVASKNMPLSSLILGIDIVPIKPIRNVRTETFDITTPQCETWVKRQLQTWKADCVLHDGAPNLGSGWEHDAFAQARLTLSAFRVAIRFLREGGWFVTKLFRSRDFFKLIWVFEQFFERVHQTKPQASRLESAELFIVCEHFKAPLRYDPAFLDPDRVFADAGTSKLKALGSKTKRGAGDGAAEGDEEEEEEIDNEGIELNLLHPEKTKRRAEGYPDKVGALVYRTLNASEFVRSDRYDQLLAGAASIHIDDEQIAQCSATTDELRACLSDTRVLNKRDLKNILAWRTAVRKFLAESKSAPPAGSGAEETQEATLAAKPVKAKKKAKITKAEAKAEAEEVAEAAAKAKPALSEQEERELVEQQIRELEQEEQHASKKKLKKLRERRAKLQRRIDAKMVIADDQIEQVDDMSLFSVNKLVPKPDESDEPVEITERQKLIQDAERLDAEMERVANELALEVHKDFELHEEAKFERLCETREEARKRKTAAFERSQKAQGLTDSRANDNVQMAQFDDPVDRRPLEIDAEQQTDFINNRIASYEKQLLALRKLSADRASRTKKARKHGADLQGLGKSAIDNIAGLDVEVDEARVQKRISKLEKMVTDLRDHQLNRRLPPGMLDKPSKDSADTKLAVEEPQESVSDEDEQQFSDADSQSHDGSDDEAQPRPPEGVDTDDEDWQMDDEYIAQMSKEGGVTSRKAAKMNKKKKARKEAKAKPLEDETARTFDDDNEEEEENDVTRAQSASDAVNGKRRKVRILTPDELALGEQLTTSLKRRRDVVDESFNRYAFNDTEMDLPRWFADDETRFNRKPLPVTAEQVAFYRDRLRGINSRPIKKVIEAKARRKRRINRLLKKASDKTDAILNADGDELVASTEKNKQIQQLYSRARRIANRTRERAYVVQRRGSKVGGQHVGRPGNVKGRFRLVDRRLKKDQRGEKKRGRDAKRGKNGKRPAPRPKSRPTRKGTKA